MSTVSGPRSAYDARRPLRRAPAGAVSGGPGTDGATTGPGQPTGPGAAATFTTPTLPTAPTVSAASAASARGLDFVLPDDLAATAPAEARGLRRDGVRLLTGRRGTGEITHSGFDQLPDLLKPGDLLVVNTSATLPAAVRLDRIAVHFCTPLPGGDWLAELRELDGAATSPYPGGEPGEWLPLPGGATLRLLGHRTSRLWRVRLDTPAVPYLHRFGVPIRYGYVPRDWPAAAYQTVFARPGGDGSAEMPSAGRAFTTELVTRLVASGVLIAPVTLHTGLASPEAHEPPYPERFEVPAATARLVGHVRAEHGRVIAVGTTVVRALETAAAGPAPTGGDDAGGGGVVRAASGWTDHVVTPERGVRVVDGLLTGLHEPRSSHLLMLTAIAGTPLLERCYDEALRHRYRWHEFGDLNLLLP